MGAKGQCEQLGILETERTFSCLGGFGEMAVEKDI